jgi:hypothetical protein
MAQQRQWTPSPIPSIETLMELQRILVPSPETPNSRHQTRTPIPEEALHSKTETRNTKYETRSTTPSTRNSRPETRDVKFITRNITPRTRKREPETQTPNPDI